MSSAILEAVKSMSRDSWLWPCKCLEIMNGLERNFLYFLLREFVDKEPAKDKLKCFQKTISAKTPVFTRKTLLEFGRY